MADAAQATQFAPSKLTLLIGAAKATARHTGSRRRTCGCSGRSRRRAGRTARVLDGLVAERLLHVVRQRPARFRQPCANDWWAVRRRRTGHHDEQRSHALYMLRGSLHAALRTVDADRFFSQAACGGKTQVGRRCCACALCDIGGSTHAVTSTGEGATRTQPAVPPRVAPCCPIFGSTSNRYGRRVLNAPKNDIRRGCRPSGSPPTCVTSGPWRRAPGPTPRHARRRRTARPAESRAMKEAPTPGAACCATGRSRSPRRERAAGGPRPRSARRRCRRPAFRTASRAARVRSRA